MDVRRAVTRPAVVLLAGRSKDMRFCLDRSDAAANLVFDEFLVAVGRYSVLDI